MMKRWWIRASSHFPGCWAISETWGRASRLFPVGNWKAGRCYRRKLFLMQRHPENVGDFLPLAGTPTRAEGCCTSSATSSISPPRSKPSCRFAGNLHRTVISPWMCCFGKPRAGCWESQQQLQLSRRHSVRRRPEWRTEIKPWALTTEGHPVHLTLGLKQTNKKISRDRTKNVPFYLVLKCKQKMWHLQQIIITLISSCLHLLQRYPFW